VVIGRGLALALLSALGAGCALGPCGSAARALPADRTASVIYVALGDSTVEGVGASSPTANYVGRLHARLRTVYPNARVENLGTAGATSADVVTGQLDRGIALGPHLVTLSVGPNDLTDRVPVGHYEQNVERILGRRTVEFNEALARQARRWGIEPVDLHAASRRELPERPDYVWSDGYHPSDAGYARWAELLWPSVQARLAGAC
jgi:lysophospholipase L1-like esterase